jgi:hypothetical protein
MLGAGFAPVLKHARRADHHRPFLGGRSSRRASSSFTRGSSFSDSRNPSSKLPGDLIHSLVRLVLAQSLF